MLNCLCLPQVLSEADQEGALKRENKDRIQYPILSIDGGGRQRHLLESLKLQVTVESCCLHHASLGVISWEDIRT